METLEEEEEYSWREVKLPSLVPVVGEAEIPELERETGERRRGRAVLVAVDHGPNSKHAFDWALIHLCRLADTLHLVHAVSSESPALCAHRETLDYEILYYYWYLNIIHLLYRSLAVVNQFLKAV